MADSVNVVAVQDGVADVVVVVKDGLGSVLPVAGMTDIGVVYVVRLLAGYIIVVAGYDDSVGIGAHAFHESLYSVDDDIRLVAVPAVGHCHVNCRRLLIIRLLYRKGRRPFFGILASYLVIGVEIQGYIPNNVGQQGTGIVRIGHIAGWRRIEVQCVLGRRCRSYDKVVEGYRLAGINLVMALGERDVGDWTVVILCDGEGFLVGVVADGHRSHPGAFADVTRRKVRNQLNGRTLVGSAAFAANMGMACVVIAVADGEPAVAAGNLDVPVAVGIEPDTSLILIFVCKNEPAQGVAGRELYFPVIRTQGGAGGGGHVHAEPPCPIITSTESCFDCVHRTKLFLSRKR